MASTLSSSAPKPGFLSIQEGTASMQYDEKEAVFYNKVQVLNRDLSIQVIRLFSEIREKEKRERYESKLSKYNALLQAPSSSHPATLKPPYEPTKGIHILDALAATGLRSVRYLKEIPLVNHVTINDMESAATEQALINCKQNNVDMTKVSIHTGDAIMYMYEKRQPLDNFDVIDLDPYGTVSPFLDSALQAISDGGLLCITCTDMAVLCGSFPEKCFSLYGSVPLKNAFVHENALRILLHSIEASANKYKKHIVPWISLSVDFYIRVFVRVYESPLEVKRSLLKRSMIFQSTQCPAYFLQPLGSSSATRRGSEVNYYGGVVDAPTTCPETGGRLRIGGPIWSAPIHCDQIVKELLSRLLPDSEFASHSATAPRLRGILTSIVDEIKDSPLYFSLPELCATFQCTSPTNEQIHAALNNAGYSYSQFHHEPTAIKTNAPSAFVFDIMRAWCKIRPPEGSKHKKQSAASATIHAKEMKHAVSFQVSDEIKSEHAEKRKEALARFPPNPEEFWGPKRRALGKGEGGVESPDSGDRHRGSKKCKVTEQNDA